MHCRFTIITAINDIKHFKKVICLIDVLGVYLIDNEKHYNQIKKTITPYQHEWTHTYQY